MNLFWLVALICLAAVEMATMGLTTIWFAGGTLLAFVASTFGAPLWLQIVLFLIVSILLLIFTRPIVVKYVNNRTVKTNVDSLIGQTAKVTDTIDNINAKGVAMLNGQEWMARSLKDDVVIQAGTYVTVERIEGVKLIVKKKEEVA